jgi:hypothetical protein
MKSILLSSASESDGWEAYEFPLVTGLQPSNELDVFTSKWENNWREPDLGTQPEKELGGGINPPLEALNSLRAKQNLLVVRSRKGPVVYEDLLPK